MSRAAATTTPRTSHRLAAEALGTGWLVLVGCGTAVLAGDDVGFAGVALAFGLAVVTMAYAIGHVSGGHFNPAVTVGLAIARRFEWRDVPGYVVAQVVGGTAAAGILYVVASGAPGFTTADGFATNGYGAASPGGYGLLAAAVVETVLTVGFLYVILGVTDKRAPAGFGPLAIGLALTAIHLVSIPVTNTSVNPARSLAVAFFNPEALGQVWLFVVAPVVGALLAGLTYAAVTGVRRAGVEVEGGSAETTA
ncbi:aquaporin Z [Nocardioides sp. CFH 31398]|uniref:aquaporin Z n=1 Tax=Nocardioides sp. CFH 31398 TaxID=2919579 RepID=UPI001F06F3FF|nr:aquaporin Z [Nocardioides sp. CFH 31398]MCH1865664.1 aquaporin Z [Nocardioides sp. CFH 31398]